MKKFIYLLVPLLLLCLTGQAQIFCDIVPGDINEPNDPGVCGRTVFYEEPLAFTDCPDDPGPATIEGVRIQGLASGSLFPIGLTTVEYEFTNDCFQTITCSFDVFITDEEDPVPPPPPGDVTVSCFDEIPPVPDLSATDNCGVAGVFFDLFGTSDPCGGFEEREWIFYDDEGNNSLPIYQYITVEDDVLPEFSYFPPDVTIGCEEDPYDVFATGGPPTGFDNCSPPESINIDIFSEYWEGGSGCSGTGTLVREWMVADYCYNSIIAEQRITVEDDVPPEINCPPDMTITCFEDPNPGFTGEAWATDNCGSFDPFVSFIDIPLVSGCLGEDILRVWTAYDDCGNSNFCEQVIDIEDDIPPEIDCPADVSVYCDESTDPSNTGEPTAWDECDPDPVITWTDAPITGPCPDLTSWERTWRATDACGNFDECIQYIWVDDPIPPTAVCRDLTVELDETGNGYITAADVNFGSVDNCEGLELEISRSSFDCGDIGPFPIDVFLDVYDICGNGNGCTSEIVVVDVLPPVALCQDATVELDEDGLGSISATDIDNGSYDNCGDVDVTLLADHIDYNCGDVGTEIVTLYVTDDGGLVSTCTAEVEIIDVLPPEARCKDITIYLEYEICEVTITPFDIDNGSTDNCGIVNYEIDQWFFDTGDVGDNDVTLTVTDPSGNTASCVGTVTVLKRPTILTNLGVFEGQYSDWPEISAELTDVLTGLPLPGREIEFTLGESGTSTGTSNPFGAIPDASPGTPLCDVIEISGAVGNITDIVVTFDISHTWVGDLEITLYSPSGLPFRLLDRPGVPATTFGCSDDNIAAVPWIIIGGNGASSLEIHCEGTDPWNAGWSYMSAIDWFVPLKGEDPNGLWTLCISDHAGPDAGTLNYWNIEIEWADGARTGVVKGSKDLASERRMAFDYDAYASASEEDKRIANDQAPPPATPTPIVMTAVTDAFGVATIQPRLGFQQPPTALGYSYAISAVYEGDDCYEPSSDTDPFTVLQEDARVTYTGKNFASTVSGVSGEAIVFLAATVCDISSTPDAAGDTWPGDITNATVTFVDRDNGNAPISPPLQPIMLPGDTTKATVSFVWMTNIGFEECHTYNIGIVVGNYYLRDDPADDQVIEVCKPGRDFVTGGGYIILESSWGYIPGDPGTNCNFGFNINFRGRNDLIGGQFNAIYRQGAHEFQIQSIKMASLGIDAENDFAEFCASARLKNVTTGQILYQAGVLLVKMYDYGNPGRDNDMIGFAFYAPDGKLVFSTNWTGTYTDQQLLDGGNIHIHSPGNPHRDLDAYMREAEQGPLSVDEILSVAYPNPFRDNVVIGFSLPEAARTTVEVFALTGDVVTAVDLGVLDAEAWHTWNFNASAKLPSGNYLYRIVSGDNVVTGQLILVK